MANRFSTPAQTEFINTYTPMPFEQMYKAGMGKLQKYEQGMANLQQIETNVESLQYASESKADSEYIEYANRTIEDITNKYAKLDVSDSFVNRKMQNEIDAKIDKDRISNIQQTAANYQIAQKGKAALKAKREWNPLLDKDPIAEWDSSKGVYQYQPSAYTVKEPILKGMFEQLSSSNYIATIREGYNQGRDMVGRIDADIRRVAEAQASHYANTPSGQDEIELYRLDPERTEEEINQSPSAIAEEIMLDYAEQYIRLQLLGYGRDNKNQGGGNGRDGEGIEVEKQVTEEVGDLSYRRLIKNLEELEESDDPYDMVRAEDARKRIGLIEQDKTKEYNVAFEDIKKETSKKLMDEGLVNTEQEAKELLDAFIEDRKGKKFKQSEVDAVKTIFNIVKKVSKTGVIDMSKITKSLGNNTSKRATHAILMKAVRDIDDAGNEQTSTTRSAIKKGLNVTYQQDVSLEPPMTYSKGMEFILSTDEEGKSIEIPALTPGIIQNAFRNPKDYDIVEIRQNRSGNKVGEERLYGYDPVDINVQIAQTKKNNYEPLLIVNAEDDTGDMVTVKLRLTNEKLRKAVVADKEAGGQPEAAFRIKYPQIEEMIDVTSFTEPENISLSEDKKDYVIIKRAKEGFGFETEVHLRDGSVDKNDNPIGSREELKDSIYKLLYKGSK